MDAKEKKGWLVIIYRVPSKPSTFRVAVWKKTRELGALLLQQSVYLLPNLPELNDAAQELKELILRADGECRLLEVASFEENQEKELTQGFNRLRNQEYGEIIEGCEALLREIDKETKAGKFDFAELEEVGKDLQKLREWLDVVTWRDFFGSGLREEVLRLMKECEDKFSDFSQAVFSRDEAATKERKANICAFEAGEASRKAGGKERQVYSRDELVAKLKEVIVKLEDGSLIIGEKQVGDLPQTAALELECRTRRGRKAMEMEIEWQ